MKSPKLLSLGALALFGLSLVHSAPVDPRLYSGLKWRNIGPFRGGRVSAVSGAIGQPGVFYIGLPLGGVWKTTGAGTTWTPVFDGVKDASCVGAIEVAPSDPNVIYVGMGDLITGGGINEGNGVYRSTDAGKTWQHLGLDETKQIPSILVDPHDPYLVLAAAQGNIHQESENRGVFRSTDGGRTWIRTLFVDKDTGVQKIAWAYDHPEVMLATTVRHYVAPNAPRGGFGGFGGGASGTRLFKSTDEGLTWKEIKGAGLPEMSGRTCVAVAANTNAQRMFLVGNFGLYRSDDGGASWRRMDAEDRRVMNGQGGYNCGVYVDPKNPEVVYVVNTCSYRSTDGGKTFTGFKGAPGGDDPQQFWFDPTDSKRILLGSDQGATVTLDGGLTWSSWYNQATAQIYHLSVDNSYPYWVYGTQQDSGSVATRSRGNLGEVTPLDWQPTPGYEFGSIVADPRDPNTVYAGGPSAGIVKITYPSGQWVNVSPNVDGSLSLRQVGNQPILWSQTNPRELLVGFQYLMATTDGGAHWKKLSPDLGYPKGYKPPKEETRPARRRAGTTTGEFDEEDRDVNLADPDRNDPDRGDGEEIEPEEIEMREQEAAYQTPPPMGGSIESISPSSVDGGIIWVGTSNGLIKLTRDHGKTWDDVSVPDLPNRARADVSAVDASHQDPGTAYVAVDYHTTGDYKPYFYRTRDFGKTWTKIVSGLPTDQPSGSFARVIRADTQRKGLLFAGTESSVYVSFDDGDDWQSLAQNLPNTSYRDMVIKGNDLVAATYGRGFWVLDDLSPLRELTPALLSEPSHLFKPADAIRLRRNVNGDTPFPPEIPHAQNPPTGAILYYYLAQPPTGEVTIDVRDREGRLVRHLSSAPVAPLGEAAPPIPDFWVGQPQPLPTAAGTNRAVWDLRYDAPPTSSHTYEINANPGETPASPEGPLVEPGVYSVTLTVDGKTYRQSVTVRNDPRSPANSGAVHAEYDLQMRLYEEAKTAWDDGRKVAAMRAAVAAAAPEATGDLSDALSAFEEKLTALEGAQTFGRGFGRGPRGPRTPSFLGAHRAMLHLLETLESGDMAPNEPTRKAATEAEEDLKKASEAWQKLNAEDLPKLNAVLAKHNLKPIP